MPFLSITLQAGILVFCLLQSDAVFAGFNDDDEETSGKRINSYNSVA